LIADSHPVFRYGLRMVLQPEADLQVVGEAADGSEALKLTAELRPDILLTDLTVQRASGIQVLQDMTRAHPGLRTILLMAAEVEKQHIINALQLGIRGVVMKTAPPETFVKSIRVVMAGEYWVPQCNIADLVRVLTRGSGDPRQKQSPLKLTSREWQIVNAVACGYTNRDVAERFSITEDTVKHHLTNIFNKLGVSNRLELAILAIGQGLVPTV